MPNLDEHCKHSLKRYGVEGREIHEWLDEPVRRYAGRHRQFRHDTVTIKLVGQIFGEKYGTEVAENIALDHIMLGHKEAIERREEERKETERKLREQETVRLPELLETVEKIVKQRATPLEGFFLICIGGVC